MDADPGGGVGQAVVTETKKTFSKRNALNTSYCSGRNVYVEPHPTPNLMNMSKLFNTPKD